MLSELKRHVQSCGDYAPVMHRHGLSESLVVDIDTDHRLGRFTAWNDGSCVLEVMDALDGCYVINERMELSGSAALAAAFQVFLLQMACT